MLIIYVFYQMEPERYGATYPGHKFPMRDWFLATGLPYLCAWCERQPSSPNFLMKTFSCSNVMELLSSQDIVQLYVHFLKCVEFLDSNVTCLLFETTFASMCFMSQFLNELKCDPTRFWNMVGAPCRREHYGGEGGDLESSQPHPCGVQGCTSNEHSHIGSISPQEDDPMGKLFAIYSLLPLVIVIIFATTFFIRFLLINLSCLKLGHYYAVSVPTICF